MICPVKDLGVSVLSSVSCKPNPVFVWKEWEIWTPLRFALSSLVSLFHSPPQHSRLLCNSIAASSSDEDPICPISIPCTGYGDIRIPCSAVWWLFRFRIQARIRHQRLWRQHSRSRRYDRPNGLPVCFSIRDPSTH